VKTLKELAEHIGGEVSGDASIAIKGVAGIKEAEPGDITFLANPRYMREVKNTKASAIIVAPDSAVEGIAAIRVKNPYFAFSKVVSLFTAKERKPLGVMPGSHVGPGVKVGSEVSIYPNAFIGAGVVIGDRVTIYPGAYIGEGSVIGDGCTIYPNVVIREDVKVGKRVTIHGGAVIGADGFGYATDAGKHHKIPQVGGVVIEDDVEVGANTTIDRGALGDTVIRRGTKIDNLVQIGHNVVVGEDSILCGQVGISGSAELGHHVVLAGQVGLVGHIKIGDMVTVGAQSGVMNDLDGGQIYSGSPSLPHKDWLKANAVFPKLPEIRKQLMGLARKLNKADDE